MKQPSPFIEGAAARLRDETPAHCPFLADTDEERDWLDGWDLQNLAEKIRAEQRVASCATRYVEVAPVSSLQSF